MYFYCPTELAFLIPQLTVKCHFWVAKRKRLINNCLLATFTLPIELFIAKKWLRWWQKISLTCDRALWDKTRKIVQKSSKKWNFRLIQILSCDKKKHYPQGGQNYHKLHSRTFYLKTSKCKQERVWHIDRS